MQFKQLGAYYWASEEGYKITKFRKGDDWKYSSFKTISYLDYEMIGSLHDNLEEAISACELAFDKENK